MTSRPPYMVAPPMGSVVANSTSPPVVVVSGKRVFRRVFVAVLAVIRERCVSDVLWSLHASGPINQLLRLYRGISLPMAFSAKGKQVIKVVASPQSQRQDVVNIKCPPPSTESCALLKLLSAILTLVFIAATGAGSLSAPVGAGVWLGFAISMHLYANGLTYGQRICTASIGAETKTATGGQHPDDFLFTVSTLNRNACTLRLKRASARAVFGVLGWFALEDRAALLARHHYGGKSRAVIAGAGTVNPSLRSLRFVSLSACHTRLLHGPIIAVNHLCYAGK